MLLPIKIQYFCDIQMVDIVHNISWHSMRQVLIRNAIRANGYIEKHLMS